MPEVKQVVINTRSRLKHNLSFIKFLVVSVGLFAPVMMCGQSHLPDTIISLWARYKYVRDDSTRVVCLSKLAFFYNDYLEEDEKADSLAQAAIRIAEVNLSNGLLMLAYNGYPETTDNETYYDKSLNYAKKALHICRMTHNLPMRWRTYINMAKLYLARYDFSNAILCGKEALSIAKILKNDTLVAESFFYLENSLGNKDQKQHAFTNFLRAKDMAEKIGDPMLLKKCYAQLYSFYNYNKLFNEALEVKRKEENIVLENRPVDSVGLMWIRYYLQSTIVEHKDSILDEHKVRAIIDFSTRTRNDRLKAYAFALYRKHLLARDDIERLYNFYTRSFPDDFNKLHQSDISMYYRLKAYFNEFEKKIDSADYYFGKAEQIINASNRNISYRSTFFTRYGQFLMRHGYKKEAIEKFTRAYDLSESDVYPGRFEFMLTPCRNLELLYGETGNYKKAWYYASVNRQIYDSIYKSIEYEQIMAERLRQERSQKELEAEKDRQKIKLGENQRNMFAGGVVFFIIVSILAYRNFRNQKQLNRLLDEAKKRSDHLLLNILPAETAEELKLTGKAKAKRFDEVTVMFTDFKNFTQASERMSAEDLVKEINFYFSEFDNIISRYNIEKIKIIGDSYMCAGGLPVANETHAHDIVLAAVELQKFMLSQVLARKERDVSYFELRIGIHTGPVVAGIVGHKKFAYDIWGDTVNTASRIENAGEENKINISGETYERVKNHFTCTYRGKVDAKNKGQIDMYFVDGESSTNVSQTT